jgi:hypothetical protein
MRTLPFATIRHILSLAPALPLGRLEGIEFLRLPISVAFLDVGREGTSARNPFEGGFAIGLTIEAGGIFDYPVTTVTAVDDGVTCASVVVASLLGHENTLCPCLYRLTNHGYLLPSLFVECPKNAKKKPSSSMRSIAHVGRELDFFFKEKPTPLSPSSRFLQVK